MPKTFDFSENFEIFFMVYLHETMLSNCSVYFCEDIHHGGRKKQSFRSKTRRRYGTVDESRKKIVRLTGIAK